MSTTPTEAGPGMDVAIARAIGVDVGDSWTVKDGQGLLWTTTLDGATQPPTAIRQYSTDLNCAFEAMEAMGIAWELHRIAADAWIFHVDGLFVDDAPTPAIAICRAILKLKGRTA